MPPVIDQAYVEILPETRKFVSQTKMGVDRGLKQVTSSVQGAGKQIETSMNKAGIQAGKALKPLDSVAKSGRGIRSVFAGVGGLFAGALAVGGIVAFGKSSVATFQRVAKESLGLQRVMGGTVEEASSWRAVAQLAGLDTQQFTMSFRTLSNQLVANSDIFKTLGVKTRDSRNQLRSMDELLPEIAEKFKEMPNGANKTALAVKLFGRAGLQMLPFLNRGRDGLDALRAEASKLGLTLTGKSVDAFKKSAAEQRRFKGALDGIKIAFATQLLPSISGFVVFASNTLVPILGIVVKTIFNLSKAIANVLAPVFAGLAKVITPVFNEVRGGIKAFSAAFKDGSDEITSSGLAGFFEHLGVIARNVSDEIKGGIKAFAAAFKDGGDEVTSSGIAGFIERLGVISRNVFDWLRENVPKAMGYVRAALTAIQSMIEAIAPKLLALAQFVFPLLWAAIKTAVNALVGIINFIRSNSTLVLSFAAAIGVLVAAWKIYGVVQWFATGAAKAWFVQTKIVAAATKAWAAVQAVFNVIMTANPIGLVIVALVALGAGLFVAWKRSETFRDVVKGVFTVIGNVARALWVIWIKPYFEAIKLGFTTVGNSIKWVWEHAIKPAFDHVKTAVGTVKTGFDTAVAGIKIAWDKLKNIVKSPVNFVIGIYNDGIVRIWNWVASKVGLGQLSPIKKFNRGGVADGPAGRDRVPAMLTRGEGVLTVGEMNKLGGRRGFYSLRRGIAQMSTGGVAGDGVEHLDLGGVVGDLVERAKGAVRGALARVLEGMLSPVRSAIGAIPASGFGELIRGVPTKLLDRLVQWVRGDDAKFMNRLSKLNIGTGAAAAGRPAANQALGRAILNSYGWGSFWSAFNSLVMGESGWNNLAQNPTSSAFGIGQFLDSTWATVNGHKTSDPSLQIRYMLDYIRKVYNNPSNAYRTWYGRNPHWYDGGGLLPPGVSLAVNNTGRSETVRTYEQEQALWSGRGGIYFATGSIVVNAAGSSGAQLAELVRRAVVDALTVRERAAKKGRRR